MISINTNDTATTTTKTQSRAEADVLSLNLQKWHTETKSCQRLSADVRRRRVTSVALWHCSVWWALQDVMKPEKTRLTHCLSGSGTIKKVLWKNQAKCSFYTLFYCVYCTLLLAQGSFTATGASCFDAVRWDGYIPLKSPWLHQSCWWHLWVEAERSLAWAFILLK